ncbi:MAG: MFS transporter [Actinomycetota bacterium]|nr:MFS transporter [Actinomycetota bacterium]
MMRFKGPLADSFPAAVALVVFALVPFLLLTAAMLPLAQVVGKSLGLSPGAFDLTIAMSDAAYAVGTVLAVQLAAHLPARRMLLVYVSAFVVASVLCAWAPDKGVFVGAFIAEGLCTSLMLIAAVPPLVTGWPPSKMPWTGAVMNLCIFGAVAVGPSIGGFQASGMAWKPLFWGVVAIAVLALCFAVLTYEDQPPIDQSAPVDLVAIGLAVVGCAAAFYGAGELQAYGLSTAALVPLCGGMGLVVTLVVYQYRRRHPLMPVKQLVTTFPVMGIWIALCSSAAAFGLMELALASLARTTTPGHAAVLFLPEFGGAVVVAGLFGVLFRTRYTPLLALSGTALIAAAAVVLAHLSSGSDTVVALSAGLIGLGVGASVSPALFLAGFSLRSSQIQRVFALIELMRGVTAFLIAPILMYLASTLSSSSALGTKDAIYLCLGIAGLGGLGAAAIFWLGRGRLQVPDLQSWQEGTPAWDSLPVFSRLRPIATAKAGFGTGGPKGAASGTVLGAREPDEGVRRPA